MCKCFWVFSLSILMTVSAIFSCEKVADNDIAYFATSADSNHFSLVVNLIGSIHKFHNKDLGAIAVFNLGFTPQQVHYLNSIEKVTVYEVERTNPQILDYLPRYKGSGSQVRGLYTWKPVALKQALDMFPYVQYLDSGMVLLKPFTNIFKHIQQHGYFFVDCGHSIAWMTNKYLINKFDLDTPEKKWILDPNTWGLSGGFQGLTRDMYESYVLPMYEFSKDLRNFVDDGTAPKGYGTGRHDQSLFSIWARLLELKVSHREHGTLEIDGKEIPFNVAEAEVYKYYETQSDETYVVFARWIQTPDFKPFIRYKK